MSRGTCHNTGKLKLDTFLKLGNALQYRFKGARYALRKYPKSSIWSDQLNESTEQTFDIERATVNPVDRHHHRDSELVIGLVGAVGTDLARVSQVLTEQLQRTGYTVQRVKVSSDVIKQFGEVTYEENNHFDRISKYMLAGNRARERAQSNDVLAMGVASRIASMRQRDEQYNLMLPQERTAVIVDSLKRPEEANRLRKIYPGGFVMLGVSADVKRRVAFLKGMDIPHEKAEQLVARDANEGTEAFGQRLKKTFYLSDFFIRLNGSDDELRWEIERIVKALFGYPFSTPSFDEYAMFFAFSSALRSADLSRQVGAVIAKEDQILATGANDCPKSGGGLYMLSRDESGKLEDIPLGRDYTRKRDSNKQQLEEIIKKISEMAAENGLDREKIKEILEKAGCPLQDLTEYGRVVHAEMDALLACARSNLSTKGATLYCTTFPCHNCAKHIIAAGIQRVVYIEPYDKSKAPDFHQDSVTFEQSASQDGKVVFEPFVGIGPRKFFDLFSINLSSGYVIERKDDQGNAKEWEHRAAKPRLQMLSSTYLDFELEAASWFEEMLTKQETGDVRDKNGL